MQPAFLEDKHAFSIVLGFASFLILRKPLMQAETKVKIAVAWLLDKHTE